MKKHTILLFPFLFLFFWGFSQNKKEQIAQLTYRVDSLFRVFSSDRNSFSFQKTELEKQVQVLNSDFSKLKLQATSDKTEPTKLHAVIKVNTDSLKLFAVKENTVIDSVKLFSVKENAVIDMDGNTYKTVLIGEQTWTSTNLDVSKYCNGDEIPQVQKETVWGNLTTGAWCYYENKTENGTTYGKLYNWYTVNDARGLAPKGFHIPSDAEWTTLTDFLGGESEAGTKMKSTSDWDNNGNGSNISGFSVLPGGSRFNNGTFNYIGYYGYWWSSTEYKTYFAWYRNLVYSSGSVGRYGSGKQGGLSVRCLRD